LWLALNTAQKFPSEKSTFTQVEHLPDVINGVLGMPSINKFIPVIFSGVEGRNVFLLKQENLWPRQRQKPVKNAP
jgi:hypothetical protein